MTRPADRTRQALIAAATAVFAESGFSAGSVRAITRRAKANQAAITYHFGGKEGLYRAVLEAARAAFEAHNLIDAEAAARLAPAEALRLFLRQQLHPLIRRDLLSRYLRIFVWESMAPTEVFRAFLASERLQPVLVAEAIVRRYLGEAAGSDNLGLVVFWLLQQPAAFVRDFAYLGRPPFNVGPDEASLDRLVALLHGLSDAALTAFAAAASPRPPDPAAAAT